MARGRFVRERDVRLVFGKTGMGKTRQTREYLRGCHRQVIMDPIRGKTGRGEYPGRYFDDPRDMMDYLMKYEAFRVKTEYVQDFAILCSIAMAKGRCTLVVEETQRVLPVSRMQLPPAFEDIVYRGRHKEVTLVLVSQRPSTVNIAARSQWSHIICFNQTEKADVDWIENVSGFPVAEKILQLPPSHYFEITPSSCEEKVVLDTGQEHSEKIQPDHDADEPVEVDRRISGDDASAESDTREGGETE